MGLLQTLKEKRQKARVQAGFRKLDEIERQKTLKEEYRKAYNSAAVDAVKTRAVREAKSRYGFSKKERRANAFKNINKGMSDLSKTLGGSPSARSSSGRGRSRKRGQAQRKKSSSFDFNIEMGGFDI